MDGDDYSVLNGTLPFSACQNRSCLTITIHDDLVLENVESFTVTLETTPGLDIRITLGQVVAEIEITDDDSATVGLEQTVYVVSEDGTSVEVCAVVYSPDVDCPIEFSFDVSLSTRNGSAGNYTDIKCTGNFTIF